MIESVLITGASGGLGGATARRFAEAGARLALHCNGNRMAAEALAAETGGAVLQADLSHSAGRDQLLASLSAWAPDGVDGLVHAAGPTRDGAAVSLSEMDWDVVMGAHLAAPARLLSAGIIRSGGFAVLVGSGAGRYGRKGQAAYAAAKAGMAGLTEGMARELGRDGIRINTVVPGPVDTAMWRAISDSEREAVLASNALERINSPEEVAAFIYLISRMPATSGQVLCIGSRVPL